MPVPNTATEDLAGPRHASWFGLITRFFKDLKIKHLHILIHFDLILDNKRIKNQRFRNKLRLTLLLDN